ncbi:MAG: hypothetical protein ACLQVD_17310 [Capsulimonadaceae bacterium]
MRFWLTCVLLLATSAAVWALPQADIILGNGGPGPYTLAWKNIVGNSVNVSENGSILVAGLDYTVDVGQGCITFTHPLPPQASARVAYEYDPTKALRTNPTLAVPLKIDRHVSANLGYTQSLAPPGGGTSNDSSAAVSVSPASALQVQAKFDQLAQTGQANTDTTTLSLAARPLAPSKPGASIPTVAVAASAGNTNQGGTGKQQAQVAVTVSPGKALSVTTGVGTVHNNGVDQEVRSIDGTVVPVKAVQIDAGYQGRAASPNDPNDLDLLNTTSVKLSVTPHTGVKINSSFSQNPTDSSGAPTAGVQRGLGLETTVGPVTLSGGCNWVHQIDDGSDNTQYNLNLGWKLKRYGQLTTTYQETTSTNATVPGLTRYTVGFQHSLGDLFTVSLNGELNQHWSTPEAPVNSATDYTTSANLGMRF